MVEQKQARPEEGRTRGGDTKTDAPDAGRAGELVQKGKKLKKDIEALLDEIDDILEENADEFVKSYLQRGGE